MVIVIYKDTTMEMWEPSNLLAKGSDLLVSA